MDWLKQFHNKRMQSSVEIMIELRLTLCWILMKILAKPYFSIESNLTHLNSFRTENIIINPCVSTFQEDCFGFESTCTKEKSLKGFSI